MLILNNITVAVEDITVVSDISLTIPTGTTCLLMGPNGSGKSTIAQAIAGHPQYHITHGNITHNNLDITSLPPDKRAQTGIFFVPQYAPALPGILVRNFIAETYRAYTGKHVSRAELDTIIQNACTFLDLDPTLLTRAVHDGFSGGEKKRCELLQMLILQPQTIIIDEIDSGLDSDGIALVGKVIAHLKTINPSLTVLVITHYARLLEYISVDQVAVVVNGTLRTQGNASLAVQIMHTGYQAYGP